VRSLTVFALTVICLAPTTVFGLEPVGSASTLFALVAANPAAPDSFVPVVSTSRVIGSKTSGQSSIVTVECDLPENTIRWAYWLGVGKNAREELDQSVAEGAAALVGQFVGGPVAAFALRLIPGLLTTGSGEHIEKFTIYDGEGKVVRQNKEVASDHSLLYSPTAGRLTFVLDNSSSIVKTKDVSLEVVAVIGDTPRPKGEGTASSPPAAARHLVDTTELLDQSYHLNSQSRVPIKIGIGRGVRVSGRFQVQKNDVTFYVFDAANYAAWCRGSACTSLVHIRRSSYSPFGFTAPTSATYYFVLDNSYSTFTGKDVHINAVAITSR
jgi:hypothetical protein